MSTSVTIEVLCHHLEDFGWKRYKVVDEPLEREGMIFTGYVDESNRPHKVIIDPMVEKGVLRMFAPEVVVAPRDTTPKDRLFELLLAITAINARSTLASFSYDPRDGDVTISVSMPIDENDISFEQFKRSLEALLWGISTFRPGLQAIVDGKKKSKHVLEQGPMEAAAAAAALLALLAGLEERLRGNLSRDGSSQEETDEDENTDEEAADDDQDTDGDSTDEEEDTDEDSTRDEYLN